jgi:hypothetical protein
VGMGGFLFIGSIYKSYKVTKILYKVWHIVKNILR